MKTTRYFDEQVTRKRQYLTVELCRSVLENALSTEEQADGRIRYWGRVALPGEPEGRILRVVTLEDGETIHNAFLDRNYRENEE